MLIYLDVHVGDTVRIGEGTFTVAGVVTDAPGDVGLRTAIGPRVFMPAQYLKDTGLLRFGSRAWYRAYLQITEGRAVQGFANRHNALFERHRVRTTTAAEEGEDVTQALGRLTRYLGLVGLAALLLGGVGVGSAVSVFVKEKLDSAALLRCLGASQRSVFAIYLLQAAALGFLGAAAGVALGVAVQAVLPAIVRDFLPVPVAVAISWSTVLTGLALGVGTALVFALLPLLRVRGVTPLRALRREFDDAEPSPWDPWRLAVFSVLLARDRARVAVAGAAARGGSRVLGRSDRHGGDSVAHRARPDVGDSGVVPHAGALRDPPGGREPVPPAATRPAR